MSHQANVESSVPSHRSGSRQSLDPYGQLLKMLMPRASGIAFYDTRGTPLWISDQYDGPDPQPLVDEALADVPPLTTAEIDGFGSDHEGSPAYVFRVRDEHGRLIAVCAMLTREAESRPCSFVLSLVRPALECLRRELEARASVGVLARGLGSHDHDLSLELAAPAASASNDDLGALAQRTVEHLGCDLGAIVVPERAIALCRAPAGTKPQVDVLTRMHRHLLNWAQLQRRSMIVNRTAQDADTSLPPCKILSVPIRHASGRVAGFLALFRAADAPDFEPKAEQVAELVSRRVSGLLATQFDAATGLLTGAALSSQVQAQVSGVGAANANAMLYIDVDRLYLVNERFGMEAGDSVIARIAEVLRRRPQAHALVARLTGDRFAIFLPGCDLQLALGAAELVRTQCAEQGESREDGRIDVSVCIGVTLVQPGDAACAHALARAEIACKAAKRRAPGSIELYQDTAHAGLDTADADTLKLVRKAIDRHGFMLHAQPMLPLAADSGESRFELLLRLRGTDGEPVPPGRFLDVCARNDLMPSVDRWVIGEALRALRAHAGPLASQQLRFSINLSAESIADESFHDFLEGAIRDSGVAGSMICFEIAETAAAAHLARADRLMQRLRLLGCSFALDDYGAGLSSLGHLRTLPISVLKIDGSLVRDAGSGQRNDAMVRAIVQLAHTMGMETVAECIETDESRMRIATLGVDYGQGFAIGRPMPFAEVLADLALYAAVAGGN
jgi:diguanylate cyclase (GGDEF)-like protein